MDLFTDASLYEFNNNKSSAKRKSPLLFTIIIDLNIFSVTQFFFSFSFSLSFLSSKHSNHNGHK